jgi:hypothetical protein
MGDLVREDFDWGWTVGPKTKRVDLTADDISMLLEWFGVVRARGRAVREDFRMATYLEVSLEDLEEAGGTRRSPPAV